MKMAANGYKNQHKNLMQSCDNLLSEAKQHRKRVTNYKQSKKEVRSKTHR